MKKSQCFRIVGEGDMKNNKNNLGWLLVATIVITLMVVLLSIQTISGISFADIARAPIGPIGVTNLIKTCEEFKKNNDIRDEKHSDEEIGGKIDKGTKVEIIPKKTTE